MAVENLKKLIAPTKVPISFEKQGIYIGLLIASVSLFFLANTKYQPFWKNFL